MSEANEPNTWISVEQEQPDDDITVMVYVPNCPEPVWLGYCVDGVWIDVEGIRCEPTHWMPLPEGPAGKNS